MFIYADETGNSGRNIFDDQRTYRLGAIFSVSDVDPILKQVLAPFLEMHQTDRIHANRLPVDAVVALGESLFESLSSVGAWQLHLTTIDKPYIATTKFVDTIFDSAENLAVPWLWYNFELFRHVLCCACDELLTPRNRERFWGNYILDERTALVAK